MPLCTACGQENPEIARFCLACGAPLAAADPPRETRKLVTVVFCDLAGSTQLGERLDPEALRSILARYFDTVSEPMLRHGGTVEKFIGDAVMCVFGIPRVHEDDALRAVRATWEMSEALVRLNEELEAEWGVRLAVRTGVNTGEVVAGASGRTLVTGDTVNTAARLEQAAGPGEVLLGALTRELVGDLIRGEPLPPLPVRGKAEPVAAWRLLGVAGPSAPAPGAPLVGRAEELGALRAALAEAVSQERVGVVLLLGAAGLGKTRLTEEFIGEAGDRAAVMRAHCPAYGESMTLLPVRELVEQAAGGTDRASLGQLLSGHPHAGRVAKTMRAALAGAELAAIEEAFWALEELLVHRSARESLLVVIEDLHWAAPALVAFLERLAAKERSASLLVLCPARPELLEDHPGLAAPDSAMRVIELEPLGAEDAEAMLDRAAARVSLTDDVRSAILRAAEGNPLYLEQMAALLADAGTDALAVPPTVQALLAARVDRLPAAERAVAERGAVVGRAFWRRAVHELSPEPERPALDERLAHLVRGRLIAGGAPDLEGEQIYTFRHVLLRDATYEAMAKGARADLHERFADWLALLPDRGERDELLGHHLEQAHRLRAELRPVDGPSAIALRAAGHLTAAGRRALARCDYPAAADLLGRAADLLPTGDRARLAILPALGDALMWMGRYTESRERLDQALQESRAQFDPIAFSRALLVNVDLGLAVGTASAAQMGEAARRTIPVFARAQDEGGLALAYLRLGQSGIYRGRFREAADALDEALARAHRAKDRERQTIILSHLGIVRLWGEEPLSRGIAWCQDLLDRHPEDPLVYSAVGFELSQMLAMSARFDEARAVAARRLRTLAEVGFLLLVPIQRAGSALIELLADEHTAAEREARAACEELQALGDRQSLPTATVLRAEALLGLGDLVAAERCAHLAAETAGADLDADQADWRRVLALSLARRGELTLAERLAGESVELATRAGSPVIRADSLMALAEVLRTGARPEAAEHARAALDLYEGKEHRVGAARARALLAQLPVAESDPGTRSPG